MQQVVPWYKQFWPWFLIVLPLCVVIASFTTLKIAIDHADPLVAEDYYKDGKAINMDLRKSKYAKQLGMQYSFTMSGNQIVISQHGGPEYNTALKIAFYHPTIAERDFEQMVTADTNRNYRIDLAEPLTGAWEVRLESYDSTWRIHQRINIAPEQVFWLN
ncbi:FixH family protein [Shewanella marina]|uniref:FixH family protein n=1 Tax=Shewanella marina TaxID=487319 RepID=UPI00047206E0|nr:FixH family protein [Shewanella marina]